MTEARFEDKVAVITGGGGGIGRATALAFAREGAKIVIADIHKENAAESVRLIEQAGGQASATTTDVGDSAQVQAMLQAAQDRYGRLDVLFNNAGISGYMGPKMMVEMDEALFDSVMRTNVRGVWLGMKYAIPMMIAGGGGCIVNTASTLGLVGQRYSGPYAASKHAVMGLTKTAAIEYGLQGVRINAVCPGGIETPIAENFRKSMSPEDWRKRNEAAFPATARYGKAEEIAHAVLFLCSDAATNIHGIGLPVDGAYTAQ
jgi:NAD(P)-dependent dehydrogenase (short-subunit alcohol dehydrogenase family)